MLSLCVGRSYGFSASFVPTTSEGVSTVRGPSPQGEELALRLDLLRVSGRSDRGRAMPAQAWDLHLSPWATSLERFRSISPTCLLGP